MNMDRKYKEAENRTSEYLELKYGTDVQSGLSLAEVRRRRHICGTYNIAKEKKRIWLIYLKKECQTPFFFFFLFTCVKFITFIKLYYSFLKLSSIISYI